MTSVNDRRCHIPSVIWSGSPMLDTDALWVVLSGLLGIPEKIKQVAWRA